MSGPPIPFLQGAKTLGQRQRKVVNLLYGRRKMMVHQELAEKPNLTSILIHASRNEVGTLMQPAHISGELTPEVISDALRRLRQFGRYDKGLAIARAYEAVSQKKLRPSHFTLLMSLALSDTKAAAAGSNNSSSPGSSSSFSGGWREALRLFNTGIVQRGHPLSAASVGAVFAALKLGNQWQRSVAFFDQVVQDRVPLESRCVHTLVSHLRRSKKWELALQTFERAVSPPPAAAAAATNDARAGAADDSVVVVSGAGVKPDYLLYRELLLTVKDSARRGVPDAWAFALSIASAIDKVCPPNAGIYNCLIETCAMLPAAGTAAAADRQERHWQAGLAVFRHMQERTVLSAVRDGSTRTVVNSSTISALSSLMPSSPEHQIECLELARKHGLPVVADVYRRLFASLDLAGRSQECVAFAEKFMDDAITDCTNGGLALQPMLLGLADSLACHPSPGREALPVAEEILKPALLPIVATATAGCATWGDVTQSWVVEAGCRVVVVDAAVLMAPSFEELLLATLQPQHVSSYPSSSSLPAFDVIMVPFTAVRALLRKIESEPPASPAALSAKRAVRRLRQLQQTLEAPIITRRDGTVEQVGAGPVQVMPFVHHLRALQFLLDEFAGVENEEASARQMERLLALTSDPSETEGTKQRRHDAARDSFHLVAEAEETVQSANLQQPKHNPDPSHGDNRPRRIARNGGRTNKNKPVSTLTAAHPAAVALMLARLNPDARVTVVCGHDVSHQFCLDAGVKCLHFRDVVAKMRSSSSLPDGSSLLQIAGEGKSKSKMTRAGSLSFAGETMLVTASRGEAMARVPLSSFDADENDDDNVSEDDTQCEQNGEAFMIS